MQHQLVMDFVRDWEEYLRERLRELGYPPRPEQSRREVGIAFFNVFHRMVAPRPRKVHAADSFACPSELLSAYRALLAKIELGKDLRSHLSRRLSELDYDDGLLNDWGIHHLHLGSETEADGFVDRTGKLLYAKFDPDDAYLIGIFGHNRWYDSELIDTIKRNWPELLHRHELRGVTPDFAELSPERVKRARKTGFNLPLNLDGKAIAPPGGGYSMSGVSTTVVMESDRYVYAVRHLEEVIRQQLESIVTQASAGGITVPEVLQLSLRIEDGNAFARALCGDKTLQIAFGPITEVAALMGRP